MSSLDKNDDDIAILHKVLAKYADQISGKSLVAKGPICPRCQSLDVQYGDSIILKDDEIIEVTFDRFSKMSITEKNEEIKSIWHGQKNLSGFS